MNNLSHWDLKETNNTEGGKVSISPEIGMSLGTSLKSTLQGEGTLWDTKEKELSLNELQPQTLGKCGIS